VLLRTLQQLHYRNLRSSPIVFGEGVSAVVGANAAGKSNLLEAAYLACSGELPGSRIADTVRIGESEGYVAARLEHADGTSHIHVGFAPGRKIIRLDGQTVRAHELARTSAAVLVTPEDADLVHGPPTGRRGYLDSLLSRLSVRYALVLREYTRVVEQRNAALKAPYGFGANDPSLGVWTDRLVELGGEILTLRRRAAGRVHEIASETYAAIAGAATPKTLTVTLGGAADAEELRAALHDSAAEERSRGVTVVGPHRDDLALELDGYGVQAYGSRGEARTTALALRVAEYRLLERKHGEAPVLLLDDFTAELDANRRSYLLELASSTPQAIVTGTEPPPLAARTFLIADGELRPEDGG
jgi:DNA replication and repair protein RecF